MKIIKPVLLINQKKVINNIQKMVKKAEKHNIRLRPHFKTHISAQIGEWFKEFGIKAIAVSSVDMALYFARNGWSDITLAFPVNILQIDEINYLQSVCDLQLLVEAGETIHFLEKNLNNAAKVWIKIDIGSNRTGLAYDNYSEILDLAGTIQDTKKLRLEGLLSHAGHTYNTRKTARINEIYHTSIKHLGNIRDFLKSKGISNLKLSYGDTPSCSLVENLSFVDEIRCGNFVFYDLMQSFIGSCCLDDIAVAVAAPIVAKHKNRNEIVLYCGAVHLSKESIIDPGGKKIYGYPVTIRNNRLGEIIKDAYLSSLSQEHGLLKVPGTLFNRFKIGDTVAILPVHSCLTVNLMKEYILYSGQKLLTMHSQ